MGVNRVVAETAEYAVLYKAAFIHTVPLREDEGGTLLDWAAGIYPETLTLHGRKPLEGGIVHRLDFETEGLVLLARTQRALTSFLEQQEAGAFVKEYTARVSRSQTPLPGFPPPKAAFEPGAIIESAFRHFGPGRGAVRPVPVEDSTDARRVYRTVIRSIEHTEDGASCRLELQRGFRHQVRCHLSWLGWPICGDTVYGGAATSPLALAAVALRFADPVTGESVSHQEGGWEGIVPSSTVQTVCCILKCQP